MKTKVDRLAPNEGMRTRCRDASQRPGFADLPLGARGWRAERRKSIWLASEDALAPLGAPHTHPQRSVGARQLRSSSSGKRMLICGDLAIVRAPLSPRTAKLRSSASSLGEKVAIVVEQYWGPWADLVFCLKTGNPSFDHVFGKSVWDWRREHREQGRLFESYLAHQTFAQGASILEALECAAEVRKVADIGGGCGALLAPLLIGFPHLTGVLFEKPHMIEMAKPFLQLFDQFRFRERIALVAGDYFNAIPIQAELYLLKNVLQQWDDAEALAILRNVRNAMPECARVAVIERPLPERTTDPVSVMIDLHMMVINGGRVRASGVRAAARRSKPSAVGSARHKLRTLCYRGRACLSRLESSAATEAVSACSRTWSTVIASRLVSASR